MTSVNTKSTTAHYTTFEQVRDGSGLRLVSVSGVPSPWSQAAKAMMEYKRLPYLLTTFEPLGDNADLTAWGGINSAPIMAWENEAPINRWNDILILLERLAPDHPLTPADPALRAAVFGLSHELCGELGLGWNRRLCQVQPALESGEAPPPLVRFGEKYGYGRSSEVESARAGVIRSLKMLDQVLEQQQSNGSQYFVGDTITAVDFYWAAFSLLIKPRSLADVPIAEAFQPLFLEQDEDFIAVFSERLETHRDAIINAHFRLPMEL